MKVTKNQLRSIIREAVRRKLELGPLDEVVVSEPLKIDGPIVTMASLQQLIDEEYQLAVTLREELGDYAPGMTMGKPRSAPGEQLRKFKSNVNMMVDAAGRVKDMNVKEALPWLDKIIQFANNAKNSVKQ